MERKKILINKKDKLINKYIQSNSPLKKEQMNQNNNNTKKEIYSPNQYKDISIQNKYFNDINDNTKEKKFLSPSGKREKQFLPKFGANMANFGINNIHYTFPVQKVDLTALTDSNILEHNATTNSNMNNNINNLKSQGIKNYSVINNDFKRSNILDKNILRNMNLSNSISISNPNINDNSTEFSNDPYDSKYSLKINKIKDDYIEFLQKEFEDNTKKSVKLDSNNKELLKKCDDLIHDNKILNNTLNDRTTKLNKIIQENLYVKSQLDKYILTNQKNEQKLAFYEEQFNLFKANNENYQKIIKELKDQNEQLTQNLTQLQEEQKQSEENYKNKIQEEIEETKREMEEIYNNKNREEVEEKINEFMEKIKILEGKNEELTNELAKKEQIVEFICKENEKLVNENNLYHNQSEQYNQQINELNTIIKHKDNIISNLKSENLSGEKLINKSNSCSVMKFEGNDYINENISKLITDNEENKLKIELLNDKIKSIDEIEKKYNELMQGKRNISLTEKLAFHLSNNYLSPTNVNTHFNYNNFNDVKNSTFAKMDSKLSDLKNLVSPKKYGIESNDNNQAPKEEKEESKYKKSKVKSAKELISDKNNDKDFKNNIDREIKVKTKRIKNAEMEEKKENNPIIPENKNNVQTKSRYFFKKEKEKEIENKNEEKKVTHGKEFEGEKDEVKESLREMNRKKNYTHKPKNLNYSLEEKGKKNNQIGTVINEEDSLRENHEKVYYLYGIDRNDLFHIFDINHRKWSTKKIADLELDEKSDTFRKDYQYEGTLLYNTLEGLYILTGEKSDTLYYFNSITNKISKICKFSNCHDNGSLMLDMDSNCLFVFGGKKITSCEYYSFSMKKVFKMPDLITDRANASFIISNNKIFGFFGFSYGKNTYANTIEYIDYNRKDKWYELKNIQFLKNDISFDTESVSTMYYMHNQNQILIYSGIQGDDEYFVTEYYLLYDVKNNTMDNKWNMQQYKIYGKNWKFYNFKKNDPKGFHFAKNSRFLLLPKSNNYESYSDNDNIDILIDYKNNVHYIFQDTKKIDIYRSDA